MSNKITVSTYIKKEPTNVWECWTKPQHITRWNFADPSWHCPKAENDLKVGGKYMVRMEAKDGSFGFDFEAVYDKIIDQKLISYTMADGRNATTTFEEVDGKTRVETIFDAENENPVEMQKNGWQAILDNFKVYVESL